MILKSRNNTPKNRFSNNMTPLIDVIFLLMIFFLMTFNFQKQEFVLDNRLPQIGSRESEDPTKDWETVRLRVKMVRESGRLKIFLQERVVWTYTDLLYYLDQLPEDILLVIEPADNVPYEHVIGVYNTCLKSDKKDIVFSISE
jgi:biopolymer transport protein ExbD